MPPEFHNPDTSLRFASLDELRGFKDGHLHIFHSVIKGLVDVDLGEDKEGAFLVFIVKENLLDTRIYTPEEASGLLMWPAPNPKVRARVKIERVQ
ncbi:hypothetical protein HY008_01520 [Candidatus Woesebacteria bacterium]|nr:hypothetical protein [Candidatus Woesebacteria bacterium]